MRSQRRRSRSRIGRSNPRQASSGSSRTVRARYQPGGRSLEAPPASTCSAIRRAAGVTATSPDFHMAEVSMRRASQVGGRSSLRKPNIAANEPALAVVTLALGRRQRRQHEVMGDEGGFDERRVHPLQSRRLVGRIGRTLRKSSRGPRQGAVHGSMPPVEPPGGGDRLFEAAEHEREHDREGPVEAADRIREGARMFGDAGGDPRMSQLQQQRPPSRQENGGLAADPPAERARTEQPGAFPRRKRADTGQVLFQVVGLDHAVHGVTARVPPAHPASAPAFDRRGCRRPSPGRHCRR